MKNIQRISMFSILVLSALIIFGGCKKEAEDPTPTFTISYDSVSIVGGGKGLQFFAVCTNNGVKMTNVTLLTPSSGQYIYDFGGASYNKDARFGLQGTNSAYTKFLGTWKVKLTGSSSGGTAFTHDANVVVTN